MTRALLQEAAVCAEAAALSGSPLWRGDGFPDGRGRAIVLVPGFLSPEWGLRPLAERDGFVGRAYSTFPGAKELDVATGHLGLAVSIPGWTAIAEALTWG